MAHYEQLKFVEIISKEIKPSGWNGEKILEIGSHDVNGTVRNLFVGSSYLGADLSQGVNVDVVASGHELKFEDGYFDVTLSCECFEHNPFWMETFKNMIRMTKSSGLIIMTCATKGRLEHGTSRTTPTASPGTNSIGWNYYRNLSQSDFENCVNLSEIFDNYHFFTNRITSDLYFFGVKKSETCKINLNISKILVDINGIRSIRSKTISFWLWKLPLMCAYFLPEKYFQNFGVVWLKFGFWVKRILGKLNV